MNPSPRAYLILLLLAILIDEVTDNYILSVFAQRGVIENIVLYGAFFFLQIVAAPLQAGYSDFYRRKNALIFALLFSFISLSFVFFYFRSIFSIALAFPLIIFAKGAFGNILPIAWAGIADTKNTNYRFSLGLSTSIIASGYFVLLIIDALFKENKAVVLICILLLILAYVFWKKFYDINDNSFNEKINLAQSSIKSSHVSSNFFRLIFLDLISIKNNFLSSGRLRCGLFYTFFPLEISFYSTHALGVDLVIKKFEVVTIFMIIGYIIGVITLKFFKDKIDEEMMDLGFKISFLSFFPIFVASVWLEANQLRWIIALCYFCYSFGIAYIVPSLFSTLSKEREPHEQGKMYGLIDSTDTLALFIALIAGVFYNNLKLNQIYIVLFSFICFLISRWFHAKFKKHKKAI